MNLVQVGGVIRAILAAGAGYLVGRGFIDQGSADLIVGALVTIAVTGWSVWSNKTAA